MPIWMLAVLIFLGGITVGFIIGLIVMYYLLKRSLQASGFIPSEEGQHILSCIGECRKQGHKFGTQEFSDCVNARLSRSAPKV